jgi:hypothetical protein
MAHDEFRLEVEVDPEHHQRISAALQAGSASEAAEQALGGRVAVSHDGDRLFVYADSLDAAKQAAVTLHKVLDALELSGASFTPIERWHPVAEEWVDASQSLPQTPLQSAVEQDERDDLDRAESKAAGHCEWEVRITCAHHRDAVALAERLTAEGIVLERRWRHLLIGTDTQTEAEALAERLRGELPPGAELEVDTDTGLAAWGAMNRFAPFGLGGLAQ